MGLQKRGQKRVRECTGKMEKSGVRAVEAAKKRERDRRKRKNGTGEEAKNVNKENHIKRDSSSVLHSSHWKTLVEKISNIKTLRKRMVEEEEEGAKDEEEGAKEAPTKRALLPFLNPLRREVREISSRESLPLDGFFDWAHNCLPWTSYHAIYTHPF